MDGYLDDFDGDGRLDLRSDTNGDGYYETVGIDADGDGLLNTILTDADGDGYLERLATDTDLDGRVDQLIIDHDGDTHADVAHYLQADGTWGPGQQVLPPGVTYRTEADPYSPYQNPVDVFWNAAEASTFDF